MMAMTVNGLVGPSEENGTMGSGTPTAPVSYRACCSAEDSVTERSSSPSLSKTTRPRPSGGCCERTSHADIEDRLGRHGWYQDRRRQEKELFHAGAPRVALSTRNV